MDTETSLNMSPRDFLHVFFKRKIPILLFFGVTVCVVAIGSFMQKPRYEATAQILVKMGRENIYVPTNPGTGPILNRDLQIIAEGPRHPVILKPPNDDARSNPYGSSKLNNGLLRDSAPASEKL